MQRTADRNPFAAHRLGQIPYYFGGDSLQSIVRDFEQLGKRGCLIGPHGSGKTALSWVLFHHYSNLGYRCIRIQPRSEDRHRRYLKPIQGILTPKTMVIIDGWEGLSPSDRRFTIRRCQKVEAALSITHQECVWPVLRKLVLTQNDLIVILRTLLEAPWPEADLGLIGTLFDRYDGNAHAIFLHLFDMWSDGDLPFTFSKSTFQ